MARLEIEGGMRVFQHQEEPSSEQKTLQRYWYVFDQQGVAFTKRSFFDQKMNFYKVRRVLVQQYDLCSNDNVDLGS